MSQTLSGDNVTDSIFTWTFTANSGDSWGGTLVDDSTRYVVGSILNTAAGRYTIVAAAPQGVDLSAFGMNEGWIAVSWYRDASGVFMVTRNGAGTASGTAGLGSEVDAAWNGTAWDSFGLGGSDQADPGDLADSLFTWTFMADSGDIMQGTLLDDTRNWNPGDTRRTAFGTYRIDTETPYGRDLGSAGVEGTITIVSYTDFYADIQFTLETGASGPAGYGGFGSEWDRAWNGTAWVPVGQGGALQADRQPDRVFAWRFTADNGDQWVGTTVGHSTAYSIGDTIETDHGQYLILRQVEYVGPVQSQGLVWVFGYYDASADSWLGSYKFNVTGQASGTRGLGSEVDTAWDGDEWDDFGQGGALLASVERSLAFAWRFTANNGDQYVGTTIADETAYAIGDTIAGAAGHYRILRQAAYDGPATDQGLTWLYGYYDSSADTWLATYNLNVLGTVSGRSGLGSERDQVWDGDEWDSFGGGGAQLANIDRLKAFAWRFTASNGDQYVGTTIADYDAYAVGNTIPTAQGQYTILREAVFEAPGSSRGLTWLYGYYDSSVDTWLATYNLNVLGTASGTAGLGSERDQVWDGDEWDQIGLGGAMLANIERLKVFAWRFTASNGDQYVGTTIADSLVTTVGDTITTSGGRYSILREAAFDGPASMKGSVWVFGYYDSSAATWLNTYNFNIAGATSGTNGLGSERDTAWDGDEWDAFGQGGALLANVERPVMVSWIFRATSGDAYTGLLLADADTYAPGDTIVRPNGTYTIQSETNTNRTDYGIGTIWTAAYYDAGSATWLNTYYNGASNGLPSGRSGFGSESDFAWDGDEWDDFGLAGLHQADVERASASEVLG